MPSGQVKELLIKDLCNSDQYIIPIYQRNYAWSQDEISLLINDILEAREKNMSKNYYIGSLIVYKRDGDYEVIDGQQRLTTLKLLLIYYNKYYEKSENINLKFEHRDDSNQSFNNLSLENTSIKNTIEQGFEFIKQHEKLKNLKSEFFDFLLNQVVILRTEVPQDTNLNHYFEIMNNRGEQLEKHEVLKARLMDKIYQNNKEITKENYLFGLIWDACADMSTYAIKHFLHSNNESKAIGTNQAFFGENCENLPSNFDDMLNQLPFQEGNNGNKWEEKNTILSLLSEQRHNIEKEKITPQNIDYNSIIDFPNFLMITLRIFNKDEQIPLNDKFLLEKFDKLIYGDSTTIKEFIVALLKCRVIFDKYIIKSTNEEDGWVLKTINKGDKLREVNTFGENHDNSSNEQTKIIKLLSMFHTSFRQTTYKEWLYEVLCGLYDHNSLKNECRLSGDTYIKLLENLANKYYQDKSRQELLKKGGTSIPNYIFNYLDYLLWRDWLTIEKPNELDKNCKYFQKNNFVFSLSRNSVEHYLPQSKVGDLLAYIPDEEERDKALNDLGNLCLISHYQNSALNNKDPKEKKQKYLEGNFKCMSPKQAIMLAYENWNKENIDIHTKHMMDILTKECNRIDNEN